MPRVNSQICIRVNSEEKRATDEKEMLSPTVI